MSYEKLENIAVMAIAVAFVFVQVALLVTHGVL
jgi:hypothetical protein